jgi:hypothetical protein
MLSQLLPGANKKSCKCTGLADEGLYGGAGSEKMDPVVKT